MAKASAKVSSMRTPLRISSRMARPRTGRARAKAPSPAPPEVGGRPIALVAIVVACAARSRGRARARRRARVRSAARRLPRRARPAAPSLNTSARRGTSRPGRHGRDRPRRRRALPGPRWPRSASPSSRAGAARVMVAISASEYSRAIDGSVVDGDGFRRQLRDPFGAQLAGSISRAKIIRIGGERARRSGGRW